MQWKDLKESVSPFCVSHYGVNKSYMLNCFHRQRQGLSRVTHELSTGHMKLPTHVHFHDTFMMINMIVYSFPVSFIHTSKVKLPQTHKEKASQLRSDPLYREKVENTFGLPSLPASCQLLSLAGGEESNGIYTSREKSRGRQRFFSQLDKSPGSDSHEV